MAEILVGQGLACNSPVLMQENHSVLKIVPSNGKTLQNKNMPIRQASMKQTVKQKVATLLYVPTQNMIAGILTKPLQVELFRALTVTVLGGEALNVIVQDNGRNSQGVISPEVSQSFNCSLSLK